jgi:hypothetical protein
MAEIHRLFVDGCLKEIETSGQPDADVVVPISGQETLEIFTRPFGTAVRFSENYPLSGAIVTQKSLEVHLDLKVKTDLGDGVKKIRVTLLVDHIDSTPDPDNAA